MPLLPPTTPTLPILYQPLDILLPCLSGQPAAQTLKLLRKICKDSLDSSETFSVTYSPLSSPEGPNHLFTLKPYYWEVEPGVWGTSC